MRFVAAADAAFARSRAAVSHIGYVVQLTYSYIGGAAKVSSNTYKSKQLSAIVCLLLTLGAKSLV